MRVGKDYRARLTDAINSMRVSPVPYSDITTSVEDLESVYEGLFVDDPKRLKED